MLFFYFYEMEKTLAIMAAGMGSRYGGLKQLDIFDKEGHSIIDFSIYDAIEAGFNHIVFIIRKELQDSFTKRFSHIQSDTIKISYVYQEISDIPRGYESCNRIKPWGTGHALLSLRHHIKNNFAIINADDFYGRDAYRVMYENLFNNDADNNYYMIGYKLKNTLSPYGTVSRGQCFLDNNKTLDKIIERTGIKTTDSGIKYLESDNGWVRISENSIVSMNFWGFSPTIFDYAETIFKSFLIQDQTNPKSEFYIPLIVNSLIKNNTISTKVLSTDSTWYGVTYKNDKEHVEKALANMKAAEIYPEKLWV